MKEKIFNIIYDNWRGYRFIYDTLAVRKCKNDCSECPLFRSSNLVDFLKASNQDKLIFGPNNFLNCKSIKQYEDCYANFLINECITEKDIQDELGLLKNMRIIYSENNDNEIMEKKFRNSVIQRVKKESDLNKGKIIDQFVNNNSEYF